MELDPVVHERVRLGVLALLVQHGELDFTTLRNALRVTDGNLARHLRVLEDAQMVAYRKTFVGRRPRTHYRITSAGRRRFHAYHEQLRALLGTMIQGEDPDASKGP